MTHNIARATRGVLFLAVPFLHGGVLYDNLPAVLPPNLPSLGYQATQTAQFGGLVRLSQGSQAILDTATVAMSNWALESTYETVGTSSGFEIPLTLNLYNVGPGNSVGSLIDSITIAAWIPWRPEASTNPRPSGCGTNATQYLAADGNCYNGALTAVTFNLAGVAVPGEFIYGLAFDATTAGDHPTGVNGPYDSLNFAVSSVPPTVGDNPLPGTAYWDTAHAGNYADGGAGGLGTFRQDMNWGAYSGAVQFSGTSTPEASTLGFLAAGLIALGLKKWRTPSR